jgi:hypothetical protein
LRQVRFPAAQRGLGVLQLGIGSYKFIGSLRNTEFQIVTRFGEQLFRMAA